MNLTGLLTQPGSTPGKSEPGSGSHAARQGDGHSGFANLLAGVLSGGQKSAVPEQRSNAAPQAHLGVAELPAPQGQRQRLATGKETRASSVLNSSPASDSPSLVQSSQLPTAVTRSQTKKGSDEEDRDTESEDSSRVPEASGDPSLNPAELACLGIISQPPTPAVTEPARAGSKASQEGQSSKPETGLQAGEVGVFAATSQAEPPSLLLVSDAARSSAGSKNTVVGDSGGGIPLTQLQGFEPVEAESKKLLRSAKQDASSPSKPATSQIAGGDPAARLESDLARSEPKFSDQSSGQPEIAGLQHLPAVEAQSVADAATVLKTAMPEPEKTAAVNAVQPDKKAESNEAVDILRQNAKVLLADSRSTGPMLARAAQTRVDGKKPIIGRVAETRSEDGVGTAVAPQQKLMSRAEQQNEIAGMEKQNLPEKADVLPQNGNSPAQSEGDVLSKSADPEPKAQVATATPLVSDQLAGASAAKRNASNAPAEHLPVMTKLAANISHEAVIMRQFKPDKLDVVLRPDATTQISLQLRYVDNEVLGSARCDRGDFTFLNAHWTELQRTMDQQGIKLSPLKESGFGSTFQGSGNSSGHSNQTPYEQRARKLEEVLLSEPATPWRAAPDKTETRTRRVTSGGRLLQTWA